MKPSDPTAEPVFARTVLLHSLAWLVAANLVGVWLAITLLWPAAGNWIAPFTWGRWAPVHMNWHLYGWCSLPLVGALLLWYFDGAHPHARAHARAALGIWSVALALGGVAWLGGSVSGKLFLDWHGWTRPLLPLAMYVLWGLLATHTRASWRKRGRVARFLRVGLLVLLAAVPVILFWATGRGMYHPINPDSGGATGAAVLGSTLGVVTLFMFVPGFLNIPAAGKTRVFWWILGAAWVVFALVDRGNVSHHKIGQIIALATLMVWIPLMPLFWQRHRWPAIAKPWILAAVVWWVLLVVTGWFSFLPGISEALKFTHALVGHAHLAMAGLITSVNAAILAVIGRRAPPADVFWLWQGGCGVYIAAMLLLGWGEISGAAELFRGEAWVQGLLSLRLVAGAAMAAASCRWLRAVARPKLFRIRSADPGDLRVCSTGG